MAYDYLHVTTEGAAMWATIDAPPMNVMVRPLFIELMKFSEEVAADDAILAVVLQSADPDFFIAHFDVSEILKFPVEGEAERDTELKAFHVMCERFRTMPKATICKIAGRVGGGGSEMASSCDMRFGLAGKTAVNQMEVPLGILPGGSGTQRLPRLMGRGRAMEVILGGVDMDAETAERWGYLNRIFPTQADLDAYVDHLARRIASFPAPAVREAKAAVLASQPDPTEGLIAEAYHFQRLLRTEESVVNMSRFLEIGGQTREGELRIAELNGELGAPS